MANSSKILKQAPIRRASRSAAKQAATKTLTNSQTTPTPSIDKLEKGTRKVETDMYFEVLEISPHQAAMWLQKNENNRKMREDRALALSRAIEDGKFQMTHQSLAFTRSGRLLDGQHRLRACVLANRSITVPVAFNVPETAFPVMDAGLIRKMYERLHSEPRHTSICSTLFRFMATNRLAQEYETQLMLEIFTPAFEIMDQVTRPARNKISKATQEAAILLRMAEALRIGDQDEIENLRWKMDLVRHGNVTDAPPIIHAYYRQLLEGIKNYDLAVAKVTDQFARAWVAFDPQREDNARLEIRDHSAEVRQAREIFTALSDGIFNG